MNKIIYIILAIVIVLGILWFGLGKGTLVNLFMNQRSFENLVERFESEERQEWQKPDEVIALLEDIEGKTIMDIGAGTGYFAFRMTAKGAKVIAADVDDRFLNYMKEKKDSLNDRLLEIRKVEYDDPLLSEAETHHVIIVNTYHHIDDREEYFPKVCKGIKSGGSLMVIDFKKNVGGPGPPKRYRVATDKVREELTKAGFSKITVNDSLLDNFYIVIAEKNNSMNKNLKSQNLSTSKQAEMWDKRYNQEEYVYGINPNAFLKSVLDTLAVGTILLPAEGEGRNAVYAAQLGWQVDATDLSEVGKNKALKLAKENGVSINYEIADATKYQTDKKYDVIAFIFLHLPPDIRKKAFKSYLPFLKPNGKILIEVFNEEQINNSSGGPKSIPMLYTLEELKDMFNESTIEYAEDVIFDLDEGEYHKGKASTSRIIISNR